jgi:hypothetical protein
VLSTNGTRGCGQTCDVDGVSRGADRTANAADPTANPAASFFGNLVVPGCPVLPTAVHYCLGMSSLLLPHGEGTVSPFVRPWACKSKCGWPGLRLPLQLSCSTASAAEAHARQTASGSTVLVTRA